MCTSHQTRAYHVEKRKMKPRVQELSKHVVCFSAKINARTTVTARIASNSASAKTEGLAIQWTDLAHVPKV